MDLYLRLYCQLLKERGKFDIVQEKYPFENHPWLFLAYGAFVLSNDKDENKGKGKGNGKKTGKAKGKKKENQIEKEFFLVEAKVS